MSSTTTQLSSRERVLAAIRADMGQSDHELAASAQLSNSKTSGARVALWEAGLIERVGKNDRGHALWQLCPLDRQEAARRAYQEEREARERSRLAAKSVGERASIVTFLLGDDAVNAEALAQTQRSAAARRTRARAKDVRHEKEADRTERKRAINRERDANGPLLDFLLAVDRLREHIGTLFTLRDQLSEDRAREQAAAEPSINRFRWLAVARNLREVIALAHVVLQELAEHVEEPLTNCPSCGARLSAADLLQEGYIDVEAIADDEVVDGKMAQS